MGAAEFIICETFSSSVIRETRSSTRFSMGSDGSLYAGEVSCPLAPVLGETSDKQMKRSSPQTAAQRYLFICFLLSLRIYIYVYFHIRIHIYFYLYIYFY